MEAICSNSVCVTRGSLFCLSLDWQTQSYFISSPHVIFSSTTWKQSNGRSPTGPSLTSLSVSCHSLCTLLCHPGLLDVLCLSGRFPPRAFALAALLSGRLFQQMAVGLTPFIRSLFRWHTRRSFLTLQRVKCSCPHRMTLLFNSCFIFLRGTYHFLQCYMFICFMCHSSLECKLQENMAIPAPKQSDT